MEKSNNEIKETRKRRNKNSKRTKNRRNDNIACSECGAELNRNGRSNDPNWYFTNADIANQASQFSFNQFLGQRVDLLPEANGVHRLITPTVMVAYLNPCPGWVEELNPLSAGINMQGLKLFTTLSSRNAKTTNYAPQDVTTLMLAMGELISLIEVGRRAFGLAFTYNQRNRMFPQEVLKAMGFEPKDFLTNLADYRLKFNSLITMINKIPFPSNIAYFDKCAKLYKSVYLDRMQAMAQVFAYMPCTTWKFDEAYSEQGSGLRTVNAWNNGLPKTFTDYYQLVEELAHAIMTSATFNYIYADVLNYVSKFNIPLLNIEYLMEGYSVVPEYNENALLQFNNGFAIREPLKAPSSGYTAGNDVVPNVELNCIEYRPCWESTVPDLSLNKIINFSSDVPTIEDRIEATRFTAVGYQFKADDSVYRSAHVALPDHYITYYRYCTESWDSFTSTSSTIDLQHVNVVADLTKFNKAPYIYIFDATIHCTNVSGDTDSFTTVDLMYLQRVNDLTFMALFELR